MAEERNRPFSSGMAEFDENFDGIAAIAESRSPVGDGKLGLFSPEKRNLAKIWPETRNLSKRDKISGIFDKNVAFQRNFLLDGMTEFGKKIDGETESRTP